MYKNKYLSIIIPVYNADKYLAKCLDTIINQTFKNLEIILVDDGSTDNSKEIIKSYMEKDSRIIAFFKNNEGVSATRNLGIINSTGDYITFVDADDWINLNLYEEALEKVQENTCDIVLYSYVKQYTTNHQVTEMLPFKSEEILDKDKIFNDLILNLIAYEDETKESIMGSIWRCIFKSDLIKNNNLYFDTSMDYAEDLIFCLNAFKQSNSMYILNKPLYNYRFNESSVTAKYSLAHFEKQLIIHKKIKEVFKDTTNNKLINRINIMMLRYIINGITHVCNANNSFIEKYKTIKKILNNERTVDIRNNYTIKSKKYKILQYNFPLITYLLIDIVNKKTKLKLKMGL